MAYPYVGPWLFPYNTFANPEPAIEHVNNFDISITGFPMEKFHQILIWDLDMRG
jgi:hypothetical protein